MRCVCVRAYARARTRQGLGANRSLIRTGIQHQGDAHAGHGADLSPQGGKGLVELRGGGGQEEKTGAVCVRVRWAAQRIWVGMR